MWDNATKSPPERTHCKRPDDGVRNHLVFAIFPNAEMNCEDKVVGPPGNPRRQRRERWRGGAPCYGRRRVMRHNAVGMKSRNIIPKQKTWDESPSSARTASERTGTSSRPAPPLRSTVRTPSSAFLLPVRRFAIRGHLSVARCDAAIFDRLFITAVRNTLDCNRTYTCTRGCVRIQSIFISIWDRRTYVRFRCSSR